MKISTSTVLATIAALASAQGAAAVDFDFRSFEGLWESKSCCGVGPETTDPTTIKCYSTGNFLKAMCETSTVLLNDQLCVGVYGQQIGPGVFNNAVLSNKFSLDQFDADTGIAKDIKTEIQCCGPNGNGGTGCLPYPWLGLQLTALQNPDDYPGVPPPDFSSGNPVATIGPDLKLTIQQLPGKSNRHVKSVQVTSTPEGDNVTYKTRDFLYNVGGGFKSLD